MLVIQALAIGVGYGPKGLGRNRAGTRPEGAASLATPAVGVSSVCQMADAVV